MPTRKSHGAGNAAGIMEPTAPVAGAPAELRPGAAVSPETVNVFQEAVSPEATPKLRLVPLGGRPAADAIALSVLAWVRNIAYDKAVWVDVALRSGDEVAHAETLPLTFQESAEGGGDFFAVGAAVPAPRTPAGATLSYRLYGQVGGQLYTDGIVHSHEIPAASPAQAGPAKPAARAPAAKPAAKRSPKPAARAPAAQPAAKRSPKPATKAATKDSVREKPAPVSKPRKPKTPRA